MFIFRLKKSVWITYLGLIFGVISLFFIFTKVIFDERGYLYYTLAFLILAGICDMFDGKVARKCERTPEEKEFGIQIDSLADTVNFVVLPVVLMLSLGMTSVTDLVIYIIYIICGVSRLAVFNCGADPDEPVKDYTGLPVTSAAIIYPFLGVLHKFMSDRLFNNTAVSVTLLVAILFVTKIKIPKFKKTAYIVMPVLGVIGIILLLVLKRSIVMR